MLSPYSYGDPKGIRTPVAAVKGQCPRPLDERDATALQRVERMLWILLDYVNSKLGYLQIMSGFCVCYQYYGPGFGNEHAQINQNGVIRTCMEFFER